MTEKVDISIRKFKNIESPKMVSKRLYGHYLRSYEQIKEFLNLENLRAMSPALWWVGVWKVGGTYFSSDLPYLFIYLQATCADFKCVLNTSLRVL